MSKSETQRVLNEFLQREGYSPRTDDDGDLAFKCEGRTYFVILDEKDPQFFRLVFPGFWSIDSGDERTKVERAAMCATASTKVAKVFPVGDTTWATIEMFCESMDQAKAVFSRSLRALQSAVNTFAEEMRK